MKYLLAAAALVLLLAPQAHAAAWVWENGRWVWQDERSWNEREWRERHRQRHEEHEEHERWHERGYHGLYER